MNDHGKQRWGNGGYSWNEIRAYRHKTYVKWLNSLRAAAR